MKKKLMIISVAAVLALGGLATIAGAIGSGNMSITKAATAHADHGDSDGEEHAFYAPGVKDDKGIAYETGNKPYWRCNSCCSSNPDSARYDLNDHTKALTLADVQIPALTKATVADVANGDKISTVYLNKFRYVDQGYGETPADQKDGGEGTPWYVKDTIDGQEKTAIYFSRSGKTGDPDKKSTEFRFLDDSVSAASSVSFWYRYKNWGTGTATDSVEFTNLCQFVVNISGTDNYHGVPNKLENDDTWHHITINYSEFDSSVTTQPNFKGFLFKFADLRGYIMISGLTYGYTADVTLKNTSADGTDKTETVSVGSLPTAPTMDGKTFLGWYDESGNKVQSVTASTAQLIARWSIAKYSADNPVAVDLTSKTASDYGTVEGVNVAYGTPTKSGDYIEFSVAKDPSQTVENHTSAGIALPAIDFSSISGVHFTFGFKTGVWSDYDLSSGNYIGISLDGNPVGVKQNGDADGASFEVTIKGKSVSVHNKYQNKDYSFELSEQTYKGEKGLSIQTGWSYLADLMVSANFTSLDYDYLAGEQKIEAALPETPVAGYSDRIKDYQEIRAAYTEYENTVDPISAKMQSWINAYTTAKVLTFDDHGDSVYANLTGNSSFSAATYVNKYDSNGWKDESRTDSLQFQILGLDCTYFTLTLPKFDFSSYSKVSFTMELGGGNGDKTVKYWLGAIPDTANTASPTADLTSASNYIGIAPTGTAFKWDTGGTTVTISDGKITFSGLSNSAEGKTFNLDDSINNGTTGLSITVGWGSYNCFAISPFYASQF